MRTAPACPAIHSHPQSSISPPLAKRSIDYRTPREGLIHPFATEGALQRLHVEPARNWQCVYTRARGCRGWGGRDLPPPRAARTPSLLFLVASTQSFFCITCRLPVSPPSGCLRLATAHSPSREMLLQLLNLLGAGPSAELLEVVVWTVCAGLVALRWYVACDLQPLRPSPLLPGPSLCPSSSASSAPLPNPPFASHQPLSRSSLGIVTESVGNNFDIIPNAIALTGSARSGTVMATVRGTVRGAVMGAVQVRRSPPRPPSW